MQVNAGGLPDELLEAELFGAEAGAYTGAEKLRIGRFEEADGGTLFLDEIGNLSTDGQMKLLRVLQTGEFQRLGSNTTRKTDVRLISATNANLTEAIRQRGLSRRPLFSTERDRASVPALRDRSDDIEPLAEFLLKKHASADNRGELLIGREARQAMLDHEWPGNVRELDNRIQRAVLVAKGATVTAVDLGLIAGPEGHVRSDSAHPPAIPEARDSIPGDRPSGNEASERAQIEQVLTGARGVDFQSGRSARCEPAGAVPTHGAPGDRARAAPQSVTWLH